MKIEDDSSGKFEANRELAKKYLYVALAINEFREFLLGFSLYELMVKYSKGNEVFCDMYVMEIVYDKYR